MKPQKGDSTEQIVVYGALKNVVMRNLKEPKKAMIYGGDIEGNVTVARWSPSGYYFCFGDDKGGVRVVGWRPAENGWVIKFENKQLFGGPNLGDEDHLHPPQDFPTCFSAHNLFQDHT